MTLNFSTPPLVINDSEGTTYVRLQDTDAYVECRVIAITLTQKCGLTDYNRMNFCVPSRNTAPELKPPQIASFRRAISKRPRDAKSFGYTLKICRPTLSAQPVSSASAASAVRS